MACNIDRTGRLLRGGLGMASLVAGLTVTLAWAVPVGSAVAWVAGVSLVALGAFGLYEGYFGWCAARAMGFRTPV